MKSSELRDWATRILSGETLEEKLFQPDQLTDADPGTPLFWKSPSRPPGMGFSKHTRKDKLPKLESLHDSGKRAACLHRFAGHELLAVEIMAYALLAFPDAPRHFRRGVAATLMEEQEHVRLYIKEMERLGIAFGDLPLYKHFWCYTPYLKTPEEYVSVMSLTFEMANLDYAPLYGQAFEEGGDLESAGLMKRILKDEIAHVSFGWHWLKKFHQGREGQLRSFWEECLPPKLTPERAKGPTFHPENRLKAGLPADWS